MFGGMVPLDRAGDEPYWLPYFAVEDTDAVAAGVGRLGGSVSAPPVTVEGVGRITGLADPYGARFAVLRSERARG